MRCMCMALEEDADAQTTGEDCFHGITVRREIDLWYTLDANGGLVPEGGLEAEDELLRGDRALWTVGCERRMEDGPFAQATYLKDALEAWQRLWRI